jgi:hypothetical protein
MLPVSFSRPFTSIIHSICYRLSGALNYSIHDIPRRVPFSCVWDTGAESKWECDVGYSCRPGRYYSSY